MDLPKLHSVSTRKNGSRRIQINCSEPLITDQSGKNEADVNNIMKQYAKTGMLPQITIPGQYLDISNLPSLEEAYNIVNRANNLFLELPPTIRKLIDNDPSKLENFISDPNNADLLIKHNILVERKTEVTDPPKVQVTEKTTKEK